MRFLNSSSSSSTSSSTTTTTTTNTATSFNSNVHNNSRNNPAGCIAGVFRRFLCFKDNPRDSVSMELEKLTFPKAAAAEEEEERIEGSTTTAAAAPPSIVARLMGIESFPQIDFSGAARRNLNSVSRSRSMNSVELMKELASIQGRHRRRAKSFRETPTTAFVELQDENFFIFSFEDEDETGKSGSKSRNYEMGSRQKPKKQSINGENSKYRTSSSSSSKRRESIYEKNKENLESTKTECPENAISSRKVPIYKDSSNILRPTNSCCLNSANPINQKPEENQILLGRRKMKKKKRKDDCLPVKKKIETECDEPENSSPSSVLDIMKLRGDPEVTSSSTEEVSRLTKSKSRRTLSEDLENYRRLNHHQCNNTTTTPSSSSSSCKSRSFEGRNHGHGAYKHMWGEMCKLAGENTVESSWIQKKKFVEDEEISGELEVQIFDEMVGEIVSLLLT